MFAQVSASLNGDRKACQGQRDDPGPELFGLVRTFLGQFVIQNLTGIDLFGKCYLRIGIQKNIMNLRRQSNGVEQSIVSNLEIITIR